jgi:hypothetical protein
VLYPPGYPPPLSEGDEDQIDLLQWFHDHADDDPNKDVRLECVTEAGECMYVPAGWWHSVLNLDTCIAMTHNTVTERNLLPALDFLGNIVSCEAGEGCRGSVKFSCSGDVPASVIFPFRDASTCDHSSPAAAAPAASQGAEDEEHETDLCECCRTQKLLLKDLLEGLERDKPGLVDQLREERDKNRKWKKADWKQLCEKPAAQTTAATKQLPSASFVFKFSL